MPDTYHPHEPSGQTLTYYQAMEYQVRHLARVLLEKDQQYRPFLMK